MSQKFEYYKSILRKTEITLLILLHILIFLRFLDLNFTSHLMTFVLISISILYFYRFLDITVYKSTNQERVIRKYASFTWFYMSVGILFRLEMWPYYKPFLLTGIFLLFVSLGLIIYLKWKRGKFVIFDKSDMIRTLALLIAGSILFISSTDRLIIN